MIAVWYHEIASHLALALRALNTRELLTTTADVLIVYYLIYRVLKLVRGTRAAQTMAGMALVIALFFGAKKLNLITVSWIFEKIIEYFIIFFVVIFQQDIRRALMQIGQNLFLRQKYEETYVIEEIVQAAGELAKQGIGALVVIERDADLSEHLGEVGVELDAKVTKELLVTLFIPERQNHMHDGAVIIRNLRVQQAGAVLPLSANNKLDKQLGTRHRAAIGITEETDAVVVVVSEERGTVSLCFNGNIARDLDAATLRKALLGLFQKKKNKAKGQSGNKGQKGGKDGELPVAATGAAGAGAVSGGDKGTRTPEPRPVPVELIPLLTTQPMTRPTDLYPEMGGPLADLGETTQPGRGRPASDIVALAAEAARAAEAAAARSAVPLSDTLPLRAGAAAAPSGVVQSQPVGASAETVPMPLAAELGSVAPPVEPETDAAQRPGAGAIAATAATEPAGAPVTAPPATEPSATDAGLESTEAVPLAMAAMAAGAEDLWAAGGDAPPLATLVTEPLAPAPVEPAAAVEPAPGRVTASPGAAVAGAAEGPALTVPHSLLQLDFSVGEGADGQEPAAVTLTGPIETSSAHDTPASTASLGGERRDAGPR